MAWLIGWATYGEVYEPEAEVERLLMRYKATAEPCKHVSLKQVRKYGAAFCTDCGEFV